MVMEFIDIITEMFILVIGRMMSQMVMEFIHLKMNQFMKVILKTEFSVEKAN